MKIPKIFCARVLVKPTERTKTQGGLIIPKSYFSGVSALEGTIMAVGPDCKQANVGDEVSFAPYSKYVVPSIEGEYKDYLIINEEDLLIAWVEEKGGKNEEG
jgi:co-chaperonin GroES (HSP10)